MDNSFFSVIVFFPFLKESRIVRKKNRQLFIVFIFIFAAFSYFWGSNICNEFFITSVYLLLVT